MAVIISKRFDAEMARRIINDFTATEFISQDQEEWEKLFRSWFKKEQTFVEGLPKGKFTIYRGGTPDGLSWTLDYERACWFADRFAIIGKGHPVYALTVSRKDVLWHTNQRDENEVVLVPKWLGIKPTLKQLRLLKGEDGEIYRDQGKRRAMSILGELYGE